MQHKQLLTALALTAPFLATSASLYGQPGAERVEEITVIGRP